MVVLRPAHPARFLGLVPLRPWRRTASYAVLGFLGVQVLGALAELLAGLSGAAPVQFGPATWSTLATIPSSASSLARTLDAGHISGITVRQPAASRA